MESAEKELAGAELIRSTGLASGSLYPLLKKLETVGWLEARWEDREPEELGRPRRRYYRVTGKGAAWFRDAESQISSSVAAKPAWN